MKCETCGGDLRVETRTVAQEGPGGIGTQSVQTITLVHQPDECIVTLRTELSEAKEDWAIVKHDLLVRAEAAEAQLVAERARSAALQEVERLAEVEAQLKTAVEALKKCVYRGDVEDGEPLDYDEARNWWNECDSAAREALAASHPPPSESGISPDDADRVAREWWGNWYRISGELPIKALAALLARVADEEQARIVAWLRDRHTSGVPELCGWIADAIERGEWKHK